jgi:hypothetical protein
MGDVTISLPKSMKTKGKLYPVKVKGEPALFQSPCGLRVLKGHNANNVGGVGTGISVWLEEGASHGKKSIRIALEGQPEFESFMLAVEKKAKAFLVEHGMEFFKGQKKSTLGSFVEMNFKSAIERPEEYPCTAKFKIMGSETHQKDYVSVWAQDTDESGSKINLSVTLNAIDANSIVSFIAEPRHVWIVNNSFGVTWYIAQIKRYPDELGPQSGNIYSAPECCIGDEGPAPKRAKIGGEE